MYTILIRYSTGNSYGSSSTEDTIGAVWKDVTLAEKTLQYIKQHYNSYNEYRSLNHNKREEYLSIIRNYEWFIEENWEYQIKTTQDDGSDLIFHVFWIGYFENISEAEIVVDSSSDGNDTSRHIYFY